MKRRYGWRPDHPDHRDLKFAQHHDLSYVGLPDEIDLRELCPPVYDQEQTQSCTGHAVGFALHFDELRDDPTLAFAPSRLFPYYNARVKEGSADQDCGAAIRDVIKAAAAKGWCREESDGNPSWPFDPDKVTVRPGDDVYAEAAKRTIENYYRVDQSADVIRAALAAKRPVVCGISVYDSFESDAVAASGEIPLPNLSEDFLGGHAIAIVACKHSLQKFLLRNSWNVRWGIQGYAWIPYAYVLNHDLASNFWVVKTARVARS